MKTQKFTLIELLITVSVIAILVSLLLPALNAARNAARKINCNSNLKEIGVAAMQYSTAYDDFIAPPMLYNGSAAQYSSSFYFWDFRYGVDFLSGSLSRSKRGYQEPSGKTWRVFQCPTDQKERKDNGADDPLSLLPPRSYAMLRVLFDGGSPSDTPPKVISLKRPASTYLLADCNLDDAAMCQPVCGRATNYAVGGSIVYIDKGTRIGALHGKYANILFLDGHTASRDFWNGRYKTTTYTLSDIVE
jgi:hypothetical protein